jgi:hypothetical protein
MSTAPLEMTKATGIGPLAGGFSGLSATVTFATFRIPEACCAPSTRVAESENGKVAAKPTAPEAWSNSLRVRFLLFMSVFLPLTASKTCGMTEDHPQSARRLRS